MCAMTDRIQKILAARGLCSRRQAEEWILLGRVVCNGVVAKLGQCADPEIDEILVDGVPIPAPGKNVYIMLNKPKGYVTTLSDEKGRKTASQLVEDCGVRVYPVGRLDMDSEGLLLFTNDGAFAHHLMHPSHEINKTYRVTVNNCSIEGIERLKRPMTLDGYPLRVPDVVPENHLLGMGRHAVIHFFHIRVDRRDPGLICFVFVFGDGFHQKAAEIRLSAVFAEQAGH